MYCHTNLVYYITKTTDRIDQSIYHECSQCGQVATKLNPLYRFVCFVDLGKRKPRPVEAQFYAHHHCVSVNEDHSGVKHATK